MKRNVGVPVLFAAGMLPLAVGLICLLLGRYGHPGIQAPPWVNMAIAFGALLLAAIAPLAHRRLANRPDPPPLSRADVQFTVALLAILLPLEFVGIMLFGAGSSILILIVPIAFMIRGSRGSVPGAR